MSGRFFEPAPKRGGPGRWIAFALAVFLLAGVGGVAASFATGGSLFGPAPTRTPGPGIAGASGAPGPSTTPAGPAATGGSPEPIGTEPAASPSPTAAPPTAHPTAAPGTSPATTGTFDPALSAKLQRALERARKELALPGVAAAVILPDGSTWTGVSGYAVPVKKTPLKTNTPWAFASVTKTFTAALIMRLAEEGKLKLSDRLARYVPTYPDAEKLTVDMLLRQTSGLQDFYRGPLGAELDKHRTKVWTPQAVLAYHPEYFNTVVFQPGKGWWYSNTNYLLLGLVAEKAGGDTWANLVHRELIDPLGLTSVRVQGVDPVDVAPAHGNTIVKFAKDGSPIVRDYWDGTDIVPFTSVTTAAFSAGQLAGNPLDLARWGKALYGGDVLQPAAKKEMLTFSVKIRGSYANRYGIGVSRFLYGTAVAWGHTGALGGSRSVIRWFPREHLAVSAFFNRDGFANGRELRGDDVVAYLVKVLNPAAYATPKPSPTPAP